MHFSGDESNANPEGGDDENYVFLSLDPPNNTHHPQRFDSTLKVRLPR